MIKFNQLLPTVFGYSSLSDEEQQRRSILIKLVGFTAIAGLGYSIIYLLLGVKQAIFAIQIYIGFSIVNLALYYFLKNYNLFRNIQLVAILLFPTFTHVVNGGFAQSSVVVLAAMLSPLGALMFHTAKAAKVYFGLFILMIGLAVIVDLYFPIPRFSIPKEIQMIFYFFNIVTITSISFFLLLKFVTDNEIIKQLLKTNNLELLEAKKRAEDTLNELKISQHQLIHSEKMASLGELTAGIAHEIQNPLNFVNNFSEVNVELIEELEEEISKGNNEAVSALIQLLKDNENKINHHGKRADSIVKGMLQHSRINNSQKELININTMPDEYLRLSYHGLRAKNKSFSADFKTELDETLPLINAIPQDIGRVLLNLINNAFYAVGTKHGLTTQTEQAYSPLVVVATKNMVSHILITVRDNGNGIPHEIKDKIFQPFFTTKPTGQGTGLGLSLSYDIIKAHGGELSMETEEGEGTRFIIHLPV